MATSQTITLPFGTVVPVVQPNEIQDGNGFFVSYNDRDISIYGCATTALVLGEQMEAFYTLNGDHRAAYAPLIAGGFDACLDYFKANIALINKHSDHPPQAV